MFGVCMATFQVSRFILDSGERFCVVTERETGLPLYHPCLYLTSQHRNRSAAFSTVEGAAASLVLFLNFLESRGISLQERLLSRRFLEMHELDDLAAFAQAKVRAQDWDGDVVRPLRRTRASLYVAPATHYARLTIIAGYVGWLARVLIAAPERAVLQQIEGLERQIKARRPRQRPSGSRQPRGLNDDQLVELRAVCEPGATRNPFSEDVQRRNQLIMELLLALGLRGGELLNLRIADVDFQDQTLSVERRSDDRQDPRVRQPSVKTLGRRLPLSPALTKAIHEYVVGDRKRAAGRRGHDYLFLTHKAGSSTGMPLTMAGYFKIFSTIRGASTHLRDLKGHDLRHFWNWRFSKSMDDRDEPPSEARQEQIRSYLMGWKLGSGTAATYNQRFIEQKGLDAAMKLQELMYEEVKSKPR